jgi:beta-N-acetylhexosaminidase
MSAHIVNKNLDKNARPGTLSYDILNGILRKKLNFNGVVFSDDMQMHAITKNFGLEEAIKLAINAGIDIMTFSNNISGSDERTVDKVHAIIRRMVESGEIKPERIDESYRRVMQMKSRFSEKDKITGLQKEVAMLKVQQDQLKNESEKLREENKKLSEPQVDTKKKRRKRNKN